MQPGAAVVGELVVVEGGGAFAEEPGSDEVGWRVGAVAANEVGELGCEFSGAFGADGASPSSSDGSG